MTALEQVNSYLRRLELKLRIFAASRGLALTTVLALLLTVVLVAICNRFQFASSVVWPLRVFLFFTVACALSFGLVFPLRRLNRRRVTQLAERALPGLEQRLLTTTERPDPANPFTELIAEDVLRVARENPEPNIASPRWLGIFAGTGVLAAGVLAWLILAGPGYWGYGASLLWTGSAPATQRPLYEVTVQPGDKTIRRKSDQAIRARLAGFSARHVVLHARYEGTAKWEEVTMQPEAGDNRYQFLFPSVAEALEYYVQADAAQSKHFRISVKDLPAVKRVKVVVRFPSGLGLKDVSEDPGGDVRAVEGSEAEISVLTDRPLKNGWLVLDKGERIALEPGAGLWLKASIPIKHDGSYHVAAVDGNETIRISDDYFIEAKKDEAPSVRILRPGHDPRVSRLKKCRSPLRLLTTSVSSLWTFITR